MGEKKEKKETKETKLTCTVFRIYSTQRRAQYEDQSGKRPLLQVVSEMFKML